MISKLILSNFQSHKRSKLLFSPGVNCIIGSSDVGKTAIIRALRWVVSNRPQGESFRSNWGGDTDVTVYFDDNYISRIRTDEKNLYYLNDIEFEAVRAEVPEEIQKALNFNEINLQRQFDRPFLIDETPGAVAAFFNKIAHIDVINRSTKYVQSQIQSMQNSINADEQTVKELTEQLKEFEQLNELDKNVSRLEKLAENKKSVEIQKSNIFELITGIETVSNKINELGSIIKLEATVNNIIKLADEQKKITVEYIQFKQQIAAIQQVENQMTELNKLLKNEIPVNKTLTLMADKQTKEKVRNELSKTIDVIQYQRSLIISNEAVTKHEKQVNTLLTLFDSLASIIREKKQLLAQVSSIEQTENEASKTYEELVTLQSRFEVEFPDVCPLCGKVQ